MRPLTCAISILADLESMQTWASNGYSQNIKFFADLVALLGHRPLFVIDGVDKGKRVNLFGRTYQRGHAMDLPAP